MPLDKKLESLSLSTRRDSSCVSFLHHQISEQLLIQVFYEGLSPMEHSMINATSGGALVDKTNVYRGEKFDCQYGR